MATARDIARRQPADAGVQFVGAICSPAGITS